MLKLYNTLTHTIEPFVPLHEGKVGLYTCGPTVHDYQHVGNFRTMILSDILSRILRYDGYAVTAVRNITDIDDKIIKKAREARMPMGEYTRVYEEKFFEDTASLNIMPVEHTTRATEYISQMISFIEALIAKGVAYVQSDGSVYFDISKFPAYGKLSQLEKRTVQTGTRTLSDEYTKDNVQDFALWKSVGGGEREEGYPSPWGKGRPGWHIECSVMSQSLLGDTLDIHVGGIDLLFPHHENEIAQSEAKTGAPFARYFVHGEHILMNSEKMAKSLNNFLTMRDLSHEGVEPLAYRFFCFQTHYRQKLHFTWDAIRAAREGYRGLRGAVDDIRTRAQSQENAAQENFLADDEIRKYLASFHAAVNDDLAMPQALAALFEFIKKVRCANYSAQGYHNILSAIFATDAVFGLRLDEPLTSSIPSEVHDLAKKREYARHEKQWNEADRLREEIEQKGYAVDDTSNGPRLIKL